MPPLPRSHLVAYLVAGAAVVLLGARWIQSSNGGGAGGRGAPVRASAGDGVRVERPPGDGAAVVHVAGEVRRPGVSRVASGTRVEGAIRRAGGATRRGDLNALNLAAKVEDGRQVVVPRRVAAGAAAAGGGAGVAAGAPVNLNTADLAQLDTLDGVGPATAQKIIDYRTEHGGFRSLEQLDDVSGFGPARMAALDGHVAL